MKNYKEAYEVIRASKTAGETNAVAQAKAGISDSCWRKWIKLKPGFAEMLAEAERTYNQTQAGEKIKKAKKSLIQLAEGYDYPEVRTEYGVGANGQPIITKQVKTIKHYPPDLKAVMVVLKHYAPEEWSDVATDDTMTGIRVEVVSAERKRSE